jgi:hypothetical protein
VLRRPGLGIPTPEIDERLILAGRNSRGAGQQPPKVLLGKSF